MSVYDTDSDDADDDERSAHLYLIYLIMHFMNCFGIASISNKHL